MSVLFLVVSLAVFVDLATPSSFGEIGQGLSRLILSALGWAGFLLAPALAWAGARLWKTKSDSWASLVEALALPLAGFFLAETSWGLISFHQKDIAGYWAFALAFSLLRRIGVFGAVGLCLALWMIWLWIAFGVRWLSLFGRLAALLAQDWRAWRREVLERERLAEESLRGACASPAHRQGAQASGAFARGARVTVPREELPKPAIGAKAKKEHPTPARSSNDSSKWRLPTLDLLLPSEGNADSWSRQDLLQARGEDLVKALANFEVSVTLDGVVPGPVVTRYDVAPAPGVKVGEISNRSEDIALAMRVGGVRILGPIAGRGAIGIEVPNPSPKLVRLREVLEDPAVSQAEGNLLFAFGRSASGEAVAADLTEMPHILVAGATNSGKSVLIHAAIVSLLYRMTPDELKLVLIDPKRLELPFYDGVGHLFDPRKTCDEVKVITDAKEASKTIAAMVDLMEARYERFSFRSARNIEAYNRRAKTNGEFEAEPYVVVVIDELADLMLIAGREVEHNIQRLAQMARAVGIHLILATQRPSVDVITGVIKANLPARVALQVVSKTDSRVILDTQGAENLLGAGDLLYLASGAQKPVRIQGAYVSDAEISQVVNFWVKQGPPDYPHPAELMRSPLDSGDGGGPPSPEDENFTKALNLIIERRRVSQDLLKAHLGSSARATDILSRLEIGGYIFKPEGTNRWEIRYDRIEEQLGKARRQN
ncbi:MAG: DNA translocase FtsK [Elusimicrobiota bacterium]